MLTNAQRARINRIVAHKRELAEDQRKRGNKAWARSLELDVLALESALAECDKARRNKVKPKESGK